MARQRQGFKQGFVRRSQQEAAEIEALKAAIAAGAPAPGTNLVGTSAAHPSDDQPAGGARRDAGGKAHGQQRTAQSESDERIAGSAGASPSGRSGDGAPLGGVSAEGYAHAKHFTELPLSGCTQAGLAAAKFTTLTAVQRAAIPHALAGRDVLGAAKTGSGKTLAFLLPVIEKLFRERWGKYDGLGALILTPTRELALQIFDELRKVGARHDLSAGLLIGGKNVNEEKERVGGMNILVCTPGRLLQHMDETPSFDATNLQVLVLDEADRILDMGFAATLNAILQNLPRQRQTLLFSATQTKSVKDLARLSLRNPEYLAVHAEAAQPTPLRLQQAYLECGAHEKMDMLWSFIKTHLRAKVLVFFSTCRQVKFAYEAFRKLRPGVPLRALHGKMKQLKRMAVFYEFAEAQAMVLFATDIAARGLDFPTIDWVLQVDCPEDVASYIHRVGRTARYVSTGRALLFLAPSEREAFMAQLEAAGVPVKPIRQNPAKVQHVGPALQALCSKNAELKELAQRAVVSYLRSLFLQPNRAVFDVAQLPAPEFAASMGLSTAPQLRFLKRQGGKAAQAAAVGRDGQAAIAEPAQGSQSQASERVLSAQEPTPEPSRNGAATLNAHDPGSDSEDDLLVVKRRDALDVGASLAAEAAPAELGTLGQAQGKQKRKKLRIKPGVGAGSRVVFDEDGTARDPLELLAARGPYEDEAAEAVASAPGLHTGDHESAEARFAAAATQLRGRDKLDREQLRDLRRQMRAEKKARKRARDAEEDGAAPSLGAQLGGHASDDDEDGSDDGDGNPASPSEGSEGGEDATYGDDESSGGGASEDGGEVDMLQSSDDEGDPRARSRVGVKRGASRVAPEPSHAGMALAGKRTRMERSDRGAGELDGLSVQEQEALALRMLRTR